MTDVASPHPSPEQLAAFGLGRLDDDASAAVETHLGACPACRTVVEGLAADSLVLALRGPTPATAAGTAEVPAELADHPRYRVLGVLGSGGMGTVYRAEHRLMERRVALKVIRRGLLDNPEAVERFRREVKAAARLAHPNIVTAYDAERAGDMHFLVMEYVEGISLDELVRARGRLPAAEACDYVRQAALGLQHAHECGMVHRDVKPANLILTVAGQVKVLDLGLARLVREGGPAGTATAAGLVVGTPDYMAPEQVADSHAADIRADVYSLGCTLYHLLAGHPPFPEGSPVEKLLAHQQRRPRALHEFRDDVPRGLEPVLDRMLAKDPAQRFPTPAAVAAALEPFARAVERRAPPGRRRVRRRRQVGGILVALLGLAALLVLLAVLRLTTDRGTLVIESDDPDVEVRVKEGGRVVTVADLRTRREVELRAGEYELEVGGGKDGLKLSTDTFTLSRGSKVIVRVRREETPRPKPAPQNTSEAIREILCFRGHDGQVSCVAVAPDGKRALSGGVDGTVRLWDLDSGKEIVPPMRHGEQVWAVAFAPDGKQAVSSGGGLWQDGKPLNQAALCLWDLGTGKEVRRLKGHTQESYAVAFLPDGGRALSGSVDGSLRLWDVRGGRELRLLQAGCPVMCLAVSADGKRALVGGFDTSLRLWDLDEGKEVRRLDGHTEMVSRVAIAGDGKRAVSAGMDTTARLWDVETGKQVRSLPGHQTGVTAVALSRDGKRVLTGSGMRLDGAAAWLNAGWDNRVRLFDAATGQEVARFEGHTRPVMGVAFAPDGRRALSCSQDGTVRLLQLLEPGSVPPAGGPGDDGRPKSVVWPEAALRRGTVPAPELGKFKPVYSDDFSNPRGDLYRVKDDINDMGCEGGTYHLATVHPYDAYVAFALGRFTNFACQVVGRVTGPAGGRWGLYISDRRHGHGITVSLSGAGELQVEPNPWESEKFRGPDLGPLKHPAIKDGEAFNTLLVVVRGRLVEVYVNGAAVCDPITLDRDICPAYLNPVVLPDAAAVRAKQWTRAEFKRFTLWPAEVIPPPEARGAMARP
jgi:WD40 repeat protein/tRNA A-37 threonylcarbamoyl transferase component Bud32